MRSLGRTASCSLAALLLALLSACGSDPPASLDEVQTAEDLGDYLEARPGVLSASAEDSVIDETLEILRADVTFADDASVDEIVAVLSAVRDFGESDQYEETPMIECELEDGEEYETWLHKSDDLEEHAKAILAE